MKPKNHMRKLLLSLSLAAGIFAAPVYAQVSFQINLAPPPPQYEVVPMIAPGYAWAPGYWGWSGERHVWVRGRTIVQREGYRWAPDRWDERDRTYYRTAGHWESDRGYKPAKFKKEKNRGGRGKGNKHRD